MALSGAPSGSSETSRARLAYRVALAAVVVLQLAPIWSVRFPALADYPNHLARAAILSRYAETPEFQSRYEVAWRVVPNLAIDAVVPTLASVVSVETAGRIFLSLIVIMLATGCHLLGATIHGRSSWTSIIAVFFTYNFCFVWGFVNYMFGLGLFLITLALWLQRRQAWTAGSVLAVSMLATACFLAHLSAFAFLLVTCATLTLWDVKRRASILGSDAIGMTPLIPASVLLLMHLRSQAGVAPFSWWEPFLVKKAIGLAYPFVSYHLFLDSFLAVSFALCFVVAVRPGRALRFRWDVVAAAGALAAIYLIAPMDGGVESTYLDRRFIVPACIVATAATYLDVSKRAGRWILTVLLLLIVVRAVEVTFAWRLVDRQIRNQSALFEALPRGTRVLPVFLADRSNQTTWLRDMHLEHTVHYGTIAKQIFVPTLYAGTTAFALRFRSLPPDIPRLDPAIRVVDVPWDRVVEQWDYLWCYKLPEDYRQAIAARFDLVASTGDTALFKSRR